MEIENIEIILTFQCENSEAARIIYSSLNPDNLANPPMTIEAKVKKNLFKVTISNMNNIETAIATSLDLLNSYELSEKIINKIDEST
ncbi:MAG: KEOPS complex subunit Pcc1 [Candidatus Hodarchaeales archaeon]|jgi:tRNA threonylcarbamoyladenosine modification (KEOPS) complex  Pcc1 subunit